MNAPGTHQWDLSMSSTSASWRQQQQMRRRNKRFLCPARFSSCFMAEHLNSGKLEMCTEQ